MQNHSLLLSHLDIGKLPSYTCPKHCLTQLWRTDHLPVPRSHPWDTCNKGGEECMLDDYSLHKNTTPSAAGPPWFPIEEQQTPTLSLYSWAITAHCPDLWDHVTWGFTFTTNSPTAIVWQETAQASQPILITTQKAINGIYRRIKGYLQNYALPGNEVAFVIHCVK